MTLLFTSTHLAPFIAEDLACLRRHFEVDHLLTRGILAPFRTAFRVRRADATFTWFASVYAAPVVFLASLFGKRSVLVIGGADVARLDGIGYGLWCSPWKSPLAGYALRRAWRVAAVDESLKREARTRADYGGENIVVIPTGYDPAVWRPGDNPKEQLVLTVAGCDSVSRVRVKGIPQLLEAARLLPDVRFQVVGLTEALTRKAGLVPPANVEVLPPVRRDQLPGLYQRARVYCQPSLFEGLPNSLCEAMLCACVPVATSVGGSPNVVGNNGVVVPAGDPRILAAGINEALNAPEETGLLARQRIIEMFPANRREEALVQLLEDAAR